MSATRKLDNEQPNGENTAYEGYDERCDACRNYREHSWNSHYRQVDRTLSLHRNS